MVAGSRDRVLAAGEGDHLRHPVASGERRIEPLQGQHPRARLSRHGDAHDVQPHLKIFEQGYGPVRTAGEIADPADVLEDVRQRLGIERDHLRAAGQGADGAIHLLGRHGADRAELLRDDDVRIEPGDPLLVERVETGAAAHLGGDRGVHLGGGHAGRQRAAGEGRPRPRLGGKVALVGNADHQLARAHGEQDLGAVGDEGDDPHAGESTRARGSGALR